eukprot:m.28460 g.28460  ORF g.28460 m.28460 type:complete len:233 (+) comp30799_c0_seq3:107-805(+)
MASKRSDGGRSHSGQKHQQEPNPQNGISPPRIVDPLMCCFCFDVLISHLCKVDPPKNQNVAFPNKEYPLFVSWKLLPDQKLRGCMGTFSALKLHSGLREYAITSSMKDGRFQPIVHEEIPRLLCSVSLLTNFEPAEHYLDWVIGIHGIRIEFTTEKGCRKTATYLPEVPCEQGWSRHEAIDSLLKKGGYRGLINEEVRQSIRLVRYQSEKAMVSYQEYAAMMSQQPQHQRRS